MIKNDYLVIGSGIAGLVFALKAAAGGATVAVVTKGGLDDSATAWAQGGVAAVWSAADSFEQHIQDTLTAGAGLCHRDVVDLVVREGPARVQELIDWGVKFSVREGAPDRDFELGLEAGHSQRRILHAGDITGSQIEEALIAQARQTPGIALYEQHIAIDLITTGKIEKTFAGSRERCWGAYVLDKQKHAIRNFLAGTVVLATGGAGKVYLYTSNPDVATGDGVAMAYRCGATIANMEFIQFHPTCLYHPQAKSFLISEALRGEGGILRLANGTTFMEKYDPRKELAPRDIVARAIDNELKVTGDDCVFLDMTSRPEKFLKKRFPNIYATCRSFGIDMAVQPIPVVPAAHYSCGGVLTDVYAATNIPGLYAIGETACTGLHGANRLASNSLLEALVFAERAYQHSRDARAAACAFPPIPFWDPGNARDSDESVVVSQNWDEIRRFMWNYVGIVRSDKRLARAVRRIELLQQEIQQYYWDFTVTSDLIELRNIATVAELIVRGAQQRHESRGLHYTIDHPAAAPPARDTLLNRFSLPA